MATLTRAVLARGQVLFTCPGPNCEARIELAPPEFTITLTSIGVVVVPNWACPECGLVGKVKRSEVLVVGRMSIPPSGAVLARTTETIRYGAVHIRPQPPNDEVHRPVTGPDDCTQKRSHGYYARAGRRCPTCGTSWLDPITDWSAFEGLEEVPEEEIKALEETVAEDVASNPDAYDVAAPKRSKKRRERED